jgi:hypothetical protein
MASAAMGLHVTSPLHVAVVEAKGHFDRLPASLQTITALGGRRASFSKYWACYQHGRRIAF